MTKPILKSLIAITFIFIFNTGCQKKDHADHQNSLLTFTESEAKVFFQSRLVIAENFDIKRKGLFDADIAIDWSKGNYRKQGADEILEFPVTMKEKKGLSLGDRNNPVSENDVSIHNIAVFKKTSKGKVDGALMTILPDQKTRQANLRMADNHYKQLVDEFDGLVFFHTFKGNLTNIWKYKDGKVEKPLFEKKEAKLPGITGDDIRPNLIDPDRCETYEVTSYCINCTDWYVNGQYQHTSCGNIYVCGQFQYTECEQLPGGGGTGGGGSGGGGNGGGYNGEWDEANSLGKLCTNIAFTFEGYSNSWVGRIQNLTEEWFNPTLGRFTTHFANPCISIQKNSPATTAAEASKYFNDIYNHVIAEVFIELRDGFTLPSGLQARIKQLMNIRLNGQLSASFDTAPCIGSIPSTPAAYCRYAPIQ